MDKVDCCKLILAQFFLALLVVRPLLDLRPSCPKLSLLVQLFARVPVLISCSHSHSHSIFLSPFFHLPMHKSLYERAMENCHECR